MTKNKKPKKDARALSQTAGIKYTAALRVMANAQTVDDWEVEPKSLEELLAGGPQGACSNLIGDQIAAPGSHSIIEMDMPAGMYDPTVQSFDIPDHTIDVQVDEEFDGGTQACSGAATGTMRVHVVMSNEDAEAAIAAGRATYEEQWSDSETAVTIEVEVDVAFGAIVNPGYESVEDVTLDGIEVFGVL